MSRLGLAALLAIGACTPAPATEARGEAGLELLIDAACMTDAGDRAWMEKAPAVWSLVGEKVFGLAPADIEVSFLLFDKTCAYGGLGTTRAWVSDLHNDGEVALPDLQKIPIQVTSFAAPDSRGLAMMVMALPTIWREANVSSEMGLEALMFAVLAHEMTHTRQFGDYNSRIEEFAKAAGLGDELTDDIIQEKFSAEAEFAASVEKERDLLFAAAEEVDDGKARAMAGEALQLIEARRTRWLSKEPALADLEDVFLTMEGAGQYAGFAWLSHPEGGGLSRADAIKGMRRGKRWSQDAGLATFLTLSRLRPGWPQEAFGASPKTALQLLASAVQ